MPRMRAVALADASGVPAPDAVDPTPGSAALRRLPDSAHPHLHCPGSPSPFPRPSLDSSACTPCRLIMDLLGTRRVDPVRQSPWTRAYGFFTKGTVPTSLVLTHLVSFLFPTIFGGCLPRPASVAGCPVTWLSPRPTTDRASLATSLTLIGPLTPVPPGDSASSPEVTRCSSVPCRPQTPWCGG